MRRREFVTLLGGASVAWPFAVRAQQGAMPVVGFLYTGSPEADVVATFRKALSETGYIEGQNVAIEYRYAQSDYNQLPELVTDLIARRASAIAAVGIPAVLAAKAATTTIPIIFTVGSDPVQIGLVASLNRPGGNLTGVSTYAVGLEPKRLELVHELLPMTTSIALLINPTNPNAATQTRDVQAAADTLGPQLNVLHATTEHDIEIAFATLLQLRAGALAITTDGLFLSKSEQLAALAARHAVPAIFQYRKFAAAGGLMSYGAGVAETYRLFGICTGRILKVKSPPICRFSKLQKSS